MTICCGIDPGIDGALCLLCSERGILDIVDVPTVVCHRKSGKEYREVDVILKNPDAMVSNGYYAMYLRSFFRRKTHQREVAEIRREFKADIVRLEQEMAELQARALELEQDEETSKCLRFLDTNYYKFPRIRGLSNYIKYRADDALAKEESHGT